MAARADRDQQGYSGGTASSDSPGGKSSGSTGQAAPGKTLPNGSPPMTLDYLGRAVPLGPNAPDPFKTGGGFDLHRALRATPGASTSPAGQPGPVTIDPATGLPVGAVPDATGATGLRGPTGPENPADPNSPQLAGTSTSALGTAGPYQGAKSDWANRGFLDRILSNLPFGFGYQKPNPSQPSSYAGADYHFGFNPANLVGSAIGAAVPFGGSLIGTAAGLGYDALGGKDVILGGPGATSIAGVTPGVGAPGAGGGQVASTGGNPTGGGTGPTGATGGAIPSATPAASQPSAAIPVQASPAASTANSQQPGQKGGGTIITGSNSVSWPWSGLNG